MAAFIIVLFELFNGPSRFELNIYVIYNSFPYIVADSWMDDDWSDGMGAGCSSLSIYTTNQRQRFSWC